jgi:hypothetical protein
MTTDAKTTQRTWLDDTEDMLDGDFVKFEDGDEKVLKVISNPRAGLIEFQNADGTTKSNEGLSIEVLVGDNPKMKTWNVTSKGAMQQIKGICNKNGLGHNLAGTVLRVTASGTGMQRKYFLKLLQKPGQQAQAPQQARPESIPVSEADREASFQARQGKAQACPTAQSQDPGQAWINEQKSGLSQVSSAAEQGSH